jgi:hypothetical protein
MEIYYFLTALVISIFSARIVGGEESNDSSGSRSFILMYYGIW